MSSTDKNGPASHGPLWQRTKARQVSEVLGNILSDVVTRRTGMTLDLLAGWEDIIGPDYAHCTMPEKIVWPRRADDLEPFRPGMLIVACDGAKALFFQHETVQILERVNHFFGFEAVDKIRILQKPVNHAPKKPRAAGQLSAGKQQKLDDVLSHIEDPGLRDRLEAFGRGVFSRKNEDKKR